MEVSQICKEKWNMAEKLKGKKIGYSKLSSYSSNQLCTPFYKKNIYAKYRALFRTS